MFDSDESYDFSAIPDSSRSFARYDVCRLPFPSGGGRLSRALFLSVIVVGTPLFSYWREAGSSSFHDSTAASRVTKEHYRSSPRCTGMDSPRDDLTSTCAAPITECRARSTGWEKVSCAAPQTFRDGGGCTLRFYLITARYVFLIPGPAYSCGSWCYSVGDAPSLLGRPLDVKT